MYLLTHMIQHIKPMHIDDVDKMNGPENQAWMEKVCQSNYQ